MNLVPCRACGTGVNLDASICPTCGAAPASSARTNAAVVLMLVGIGVAVSGILIPLLL